MNGDNIYDKKTGETYEEHSLRMRDERIAMLEAEIKTMIDDLNWQTKRNNSNQDDNIKLLEERTRLIEVLKVAKRFVPHPDTIQWEEREIDLQSAVDACSDIKIGDEA